MRVIDPRDREKSLELDVRVISYGHPGGHLDPPEGPELEIIGISDEDGNEMVLSGPMCEFSAQQMDDLENQMYEKWESEEGAY